MGAYPCRPVAGDLAGTALLADPLGINDYGIRGPRLRSSERIIVERNAALLDDPAVALPSPRCPGNPRGAC